MINIAYCGWAEGLSGNENDEHIKGEDRDRERKKSKNGSNRSRIAQSQSHQLANWLIQIVFGRTQTRMAYICALAHTKIYESADTISKSS